MKKNLESEFQTGNLDSPALNSVLKRLPLEELHHYEQIPIVFVDLVDGANVGVVQGRGGFRLPLKSAERLRVSGYIIRKEFQGDETIEFDVLGLVHNPHPPTTELLKDAIVRDGLAEKWLGLLHWRRYQVASGGKSMNLRDLQTKSAPISE